MSTPQPDVPPGVPQDVPPDAPPDVPQDESLDWDAPPPRRRGYTMRNPVMLALVLVGSIFLLVKYWPSVQYLIDARNPADCGQISERPVLKHQGAALPELSHNLFCQIDGVVQNFTVLATGEPSDHPNPRKRNEGRKYYVKLDGDKVFAVLAADREDVMNHRERQGSLLGFEVNTTGRIIDPDAEPGYGATARTLRLKFGLPDKEPLRIFDTTDAPSSRWTAVLASIFLLLTASLAMVGLVRIARARLAQREAPPAT